MTDQSGKAGTDGFARMREQVEASVNRQLNTRHLDRFWALKGGISARMYAFEVGGKRYVARQPSAYTFRQNPHAAAQEFAVISAVHGAGVQVPRPLWVDQPSDDLPHPIFVLEYIEGEPIVAPRDSTHFARCLAQQLAAIHNVSLVEGVFEDLELQTAKHIEPVEDMNMLLLEPEIREALGSVPAKVASNPAVLRHGDFWPGNILWRNDEIVSVVDWEEALIGEPLADLAISRLDVLWVAGIEAADALTEHYFAQRSLDISDLPYWDLLAAMRPIRNLEDWAPSYPPLGRPDITTESMARDHNLFVRRALREF